MVKKRMVEDLADYNGLPKKKMVERKKKKGAFKKKNTAPKKKAATNKKASSYSGAMALEQLTIFETWHYNSLGKKYLGELQMEYKDNDKFWPFTNYHQ